MTDLESNAKQHGYSVKYEVVIKQHNCGTPKVSVISLPSR